MYRTLMNAKIHRATVTEANLNYVGSITIDRSLLDEVGILPHEKVQIVNNNNGERFETYVIAGERDSGVICLNGAAARRVQKGDIVIIMSYAMLTYEQALQHQPKIAVLDEQNQIEQLITEEAPMTIL
ncbi:aspartate 1-decarboxylase [Filobacillus milosensis]|uniref:Aspartate 1-decarboxylase n=1 Tax=Filobacillus milosensis TaxID=94137 RepID=A0A4Y8IT70_9BACI|nr:aspartate 1-decarboxylase [Filobacillus milosensis]TFB23987.1 aspartate 1-decarboxylase [Filobacillus milosensis]